MNQFFHNLGRNTFSLAEDHWRVKDNTKVTRSRNSKAMQFIIDTIIIIIATIDV